MAFSTSRVCEMPVSAFFSRNILVMRESSMRTVCGDLRLFISYYLLLMERLYVRIVRIASICCNKFENILCRCYTQSRETSEVPHEKTGKYGRNSISYQCSTPARAHQGQPLFNTLSYFRPVFVHPRVISRQLSGIFAITPKRCCLFFVVRERAYDSVAPV